MRANLLGFKQVDARRTKSPCRDFSDGERFEFQGAREQQDDDRTDGDDHGGMIGSREIQPDGEQALIDDDSEETEIGEWPDVAQPQRLRVRAA